MKYDVFCMASNESLYIADFIFHHIYKGFANIFVGINDTSHDFTKIIVEKISAFYPLVKIVDTNAADISNNKYSSSSYSIILKNAYTSSSSDFFLPIDVDEFFISSLLPESVEAALAPLQPFDCLTLPYIDQVYAEHVCNKPLSCDKISTVFNMWTKSITSYKSALHYIAPHVPCFDKAANPDALTVINPKGHRRVPIVHANGSFTYNSFLEQKLPAASYLEIPFVFHQRLRSRLEYSRRCVTPWPGMGKYFYENRQGYLYTLFDSESTAILRKLIQPSSYQMYLASLEQFLRETNVQDLVFEARQLVRTDVIEELIRSIPRQAVIDEKTTWTRTFQGTPFLGLLDEIAT
jgi:hypothetical protein